MIEEIIIGILFLIAAAYLGRKLYLNFRTDKGCAKGCGCSEAEIKRANKQGA